MSTRTQPLHQENVEAPTWPLWIALAIMLVITLTGRLTAPSNIYKHDQPKTIAYTTDIALHGRWLLPSDTLGQLATKPPMYNWMAQPTVGWLGHYDEWSHKTPALFSSLVTLILCIWITRWLARQTEGQGDPDHIGYHPIPNPQAIGLVAGLIWLSSYPSAKMFFLARPDPVLMMFLVGAWVLSTVLLIGNPQSRWLAALCLWLCVTGAALTKGPVAFLPIIYIVLGARVLGGRWGLMHRTGLWWGLPLALSLFSIWAYLAYQQSPEHFVTVFGSEVAMRFTESRSKYGQMSPWLVILASIWEMPFYFLARFVPWSVPALGMLAHMTRQGWFKHRLGPALLWFCIVIVFFSCLSLKRADYLVPMYPAAAAMAAYCLVIVLERYGLTPNRVAVMSILVAILVVAHAHITSQAAREHLGDHVVQFAHRALQITGDEPIALQETGYNGLQSLLGQHQPNGQIIDLSRYAWLIRPISPGEQPVLRSEPIPDRGSRRLTLGLYRLRSGQEVIGRSMHP